VAGWGTGAVGAARPAAGQTAVASERAANAIGRKRTAIMARACGKKLKE